MTGDHITDEDFAHALFVGHVETETEFRAQSVRYVSDRDAIEVVTTRKAGFLIPRTWIGVLQDDKLANLAIWPDGSAIELEQDIHISVDGLIMAMLPAMLPDQAILALLAGREKSNERAPGDARATRPTRDLANAAVA